MPEVKEELNEQVEGQEGQEGQEVVQETSKEDDYFNPFADVSEDDKAEDAKVEEKDQEEEKEEVTPEKKDENITAEYRADKQAGKEVRQYVQANPMFAEYAEELQEIASKAIQRGHNKPVEFAIRNLKSPQEWMEIGKQSGMESATAVLNSRVGGASPSKSGSSSVDYSKMSSADFNKQVSAIKNRI